MAQTKTISRSQSSSFELLKPNSEIRSEVEEYIKILPDTSILKSGADASSAIADIIKIREGLKFNLKRDSLDTDIHYCDGIKCLINSDKAFHVLIGENQEIRVQNSSNSSIKVRVSHLEVTERKTDSIKGRSHARDPITIPAYQAKTISN